jgi:flagella basal body P-ring formation protein FlgA
MFGLALPQGARAFSGETEIRDFIKQMYGDNEVQIVFPQPPPALRDRAKLNSISFAKVPDFSGEGVCLVGVEGKNGAESNVYVPFKTLVKRKLYVAKRDIAKGEDIHLVDLTVKETYLNGSGNSYPDRAEELSNKTAKKEIRAGEILTRQHLDDQTAVKKGDTVTMTVENSRLLIQSKGVALEKGKIGDSVKIKSASGKQIVGRINGNDSVIVDF